MTHSFLIQLDQKQAEALLDLLKEGAAAMQHQAFLVQEQIKASEEVLPAQKLRERLHICRSTERKLCKEGLLKPKYLGRLVFYLWPDVVEALKRKNELLLPPKLRKAKRNIKQ